MGETQREMNLSEWMAQLPSSHRARKECNFLVARVKKLEETENNLVKAKRFLSQVIQDKFKPFDVKPGVTEEWDNLVDEVCKFIGCEHE